MSKNVDCAKMIYYETLLLAVLFVVLQSCFLNGLITLQMANTNLFIPHQMAH